MNRFFGRRDSSFFLVDEASAHHMVSVLRLVEGEEIEGVDDGVIYRCLIAKREPLTISIIGKKEASSESSLNLILGFSLLKGGHDELVLQKGTELGVYSFAPFISSRTIILLDDKGKKKREERFEKIIEGAASQSKRSVIPTLLPISSYNDLLSSNADIRLIAYEGEAGKSDTLDSYLVGAKKGQSVLILVGPEGGFSEEEVDKAFKSGFSLLSLGRRILRAETASIFASSIVSLKGDSL